MDEVRRSGSYFQEKFCGMQYCMSRPSGSPVLIIQYSEGRPFFKCQLLTEWLQCFSYGLVGHYKVELNIPLEIEMKSLPFTSDLKDN